MSLWSKLSAMKAKIRMPSLDGFLIKLNSFFAATLYVGLKWVVVNHQSATKGNGGCEHYEAKFIRVVVSELVTLHLLMSTVYIGLGRLVLMVVKYDSPVLKSSMFLKSEMVGLNLSGVSYIGLILVGIFFTDYLRTGISCAAV